MRGLSEPPKKILFVRNDRIGDFLMNLPSLKAIKSAFPVSRITAVLSNRVRELAEGCSLIERIIYFEPKSSVIEKMSLYHDLLREKFDTVIISNPSRFFHALALGLGIPRRVGYDRKWGFCLNRKIKDEKYQCRKHEIEYNLDLVGLIGAKSDPVEFNLEVPTHLPEIVSELIVQKAGDSRERWVAIHTGTSNPHKRWPLENFMRLCERLLEEPQLLLVLIGGEEEKPMADTVAAALKGRVVSLTGELNLRELGSFLRRCALLVSSDSGPVHIAAAVGTKVVVLFAKEAKGSHPVRWRPWGEGHRVIYKPLGDIQVDEVFKEIKEVMSHEAIPYR